MLKQSITLRVELVARWNVLLQEEQQEVVVATATIAIL
jgi:hypothetical protein